jgi:hypothetical protein
VVHRQYIRDCKRYVCMLDLGHMVEHIPGLPDLILFLANNVSVVHVLRCGLTSGMLSGKRVLALILLIMTGGSLKIISNWAVLTPNSWICFNCWPIH